MHTVSRLIPAVAALAMAAAPAFAQGAPATRHMLVKYQPVSGEYCFDTAPLDNGATSVSRLPSVECKTRAGWALDGLTIARR
ncbi:hypothetical protein HZF05_09270 [Sphingomonas sp. CGMCC 1.13654]|uniref:Uncharacterized protein n=1 Tax=Sphingomonas chungangi TaxID=2683589 RepID=A0A838L718_9SPHN|nr:hypothetical protein [Sphingomonas chungangi]MBA2934289.1 hypothetical protein [Sphingomonas chungangi]MVW57330.1 hypothetical protein [Sphingomonas chungangi]